MLCQLSSFPLPPSPHQRLIEQDAIATFRIAGELICVTASMRLAPSVGRLLSLGADGR
jgi:hypothetical protein